MRKRKLDWFWVLMAIGVALVTYAVSNNTTHVEAREKQTEEQWEREICNEAFRYSNVMELLEWCDKKYGV